MQPKTTESSPRVIAPASRPSFPEAAGERLRQHIKAKGLAYVLAVSEIKGHLIPKLLCGMPILEGNIMLALAGLARLDAADAPPKPVTARRPRTLRKAAPVATPTSLSEPPPPAAACG